ncbi:hypothetical protein [Bradyrhizobium centrolobii]|uniref:hypothetical protein n=1 Tax=Bradyrhizobium centrolobii TaxID=1505087 RepID=UPI001FD8CE71|nr:hypothetical protein [Bradyrhizobium centrolobii]
MSEPGDRKIGDGATLFLVEPYRAANSGGHAGERLDTDAANARNEIGFDEAVR